GRAADEIGIARRLAVERFRQRLARDGHLVNAEIRVVDDGLPILPPTRVEREPATPALVPGVRRARAEAKPDWPAQTVRMPAEKPAAPSALKASVPIGEWQPDPNFHAVSRGRMRDDRRDAAHAIGSIDHRRFDRGVRQRQVRQTLARAGGRETRIERLKWSLSAPEQAETAGECCDEDRAVESE